MVPDNLHIEVQREPWMAGIAIYISTIDPNRRRASLLKQDGTWVDVKEGDRFPEPSLRLQDDGGRVLLQALTKHYDGAEDTRQLRQDYNAERKRVDGLLATVSQIAVGITHSRQEDRT